MPDPSSCLDLAEASFAYGSTVILNRISGSLPSGRFYGILGPNGSGKTTLLDLMAGHKKPVRGGVLYRSRPVAGIAKSDLARHIALVSQNFYINFPFTVRDVVMMGRYPYIPRFSRPAETDDEIVDAAMAITGVDRMQGCLITELSGGERQRAVFARALAQDTDVLLLDEATSNLDITHTLSLLDTVRRRVREAGLTVVSVFQDINLAAVFCDELLFLKQGTLVARGPTDALMNEDLLEKVFEVRSRIRLEPEYGARQAVFRIGGV
ncbi:MAG: iron ABC transporter [Desulfobacterales bacterium]|nr:MAG: iron ABC transporter [Desulfobacterales bacterium]